jgi:intracellular sulfur oxidation DsrE/DsrF family protein
MIATIHCLSGRVFGGQKPKEKAMSKLVVVLATTALFGSAVSTFATEVGATAQTRVAQFAQTTVSAPGKAKAKIDAPDPRGNVKEHRVAIQVDQNDPDVMNLALNNAKNIIEHYRRRGEKVDVEIVTFGPGLHMLRADTSQVKDRIKDMAGQYSSMIKFSACNNTKEGMEKREGRIISIIPEATTVGSGVVQLMELQEKGWSYLRP